MTDSRRGASLIDLLVSLAILALLFGGIYTVYFSIIDSTNSVDARASGAAVIARQVEIIRNLPYDKVGTVGGIPAGTILPEETIIFGEKIFNVGTSIRNIDDPFDGTLGGAQNDTAPADYKLVSLSVSCVSCKRFAPLAFTTTVAPKNLESASSTGSLFINVFDAAGFPVSGTVVRVTNASVTPSISITDTTNNEGILQLVGVPSSTQSYRVEVSKPGYSSDRSYPLGGAGNPNPSKPDATVAVQTITNMSFAIDRTGSIAVRTSDHACAPTGNHDFTIEGAKTIGPGVLKFSTTSETDASGIRNFSGMEWDTYSFSFDDPAYELRGTIPLLPFLLDPGEAADVRFVTGPESGNSLMLSFVRSGTGAGVPDADVTLSRPGYSTSTLAGRAITVHTDWSGASYAMKDPEIATETTPGKMHLAANASGTYPSGTYTLTSETIDLGGPSASLHELSWNSVLPPFVGPEAVRFRVAANNDNATWSYVGTDGTGSTYFDSSGTSLPASLSGKRYVRYRAYLSTLNENVTPEVEDVALTWTGPCVPPHNAFFHNLSAATYTLEVNAPGYAYNSTSVTVGAGWQGAVITLTPL